MGTGYTRADTANNIADGNIINASDLDSEYDAIQSAFNASTGHTHDGTTGEGAPIETIGPSQDVVATASVLRPKTDNTVDLGTTTLEYKDLFLDGTAHIDTLDVDENASITGTLGVTGATTLSSTLGVTGATTLSSTLGVTGATTLSSTLGVTGAATLSSTLAVTGATGIDGDFDINTNKFTVASATGNTVVAGTLGVTGATTATGGLNVDTISEITSANGVVIDGVTLKDGGATVTADVNFGDNDKAIFGAGSDLQIYHDASDSIINDNGAGSLKLQTGGSTKLATTSTGIDVTGSISADGLTVDGNVSLNGGTSATIITSDANRSGAGFQISGLLGKWNGTNAANIGIYTGSDTTNKDDGVVKIQTSEFLGTLRDRALFANNGDISFYEDTGTTPKFFWDASAESLGIGTTSPFSTSQILNTGWSSGAPYGTVLTVTGNNTNDANWGHLLISDSTTTTGSGGSLRFAVGSTLSDLSPHAGIDGYTEGTNYGGLKFLTRPNGGTHAERMRIDSSGNVGIGDSSPYTWSSVQPSLNLRGTSASFPNRSGALIFKSQAGTHMTVMDFETGNDLRWYQSSNSGSSWDERMRLDSSGNVGIGTSSPSYPLTVSGKISYNGAIGEGADNTLSSSGTTLILGESATWQNWSLRTNGAEAMRIDSSGNVGIGTSSPAVPLHVKVNTDQNFYMSSDSGVRIQAINDAGSVINTMKIGGDPLVFLGTGGTERMRIDSNGNLLIAGTGTPTSSVGNLVLYNGTAPTGSATDGVILYAEDVSSSSELKVRDEAGNVTTLSPHNFDLIPEGPSEDMAWSYYSERDGKRINVDMLKAIRLLEQISGEKLVHMV